MPGRIALLRGAAAAFLIAVLPDAVLAVTVPDGFVVENVTAGTGFNTPTGFAFTPDGRVFVAEKLGRVRVVRDGVKLPEPLWDGQAEVLNNGDRGLLGIAVDPDFLVNRYVYLLYTVDPDSDGVDDNDDAFGRLTRYRTSPSNPNALDPDSRTVLIGATWRDGFPSGSPSHTIGTLRFGEDRSLLVSVGEGAAYAGADSGGRDPDMFAPGHVDPVEDIGAYRALDLRSLAGKILRVNPQTGAGYISNPYFDGNLHSARSRVWAYGLRNPFRFCVRPGSGAADTSAGMPGVLAIGDVGARGWEEIDLSRRGENFGWPCSEGPLPQPLYSTLAPTWGGCATVGSAANPTSPSAPTLTWNHDDSTRSIPRGMRGGCSVGGVFYSGRDYPSWCRDKLFFADFNAGWIRVAAIDGDLRLGEVLDFGGDAQGPVDFATDPVTGDLWMLSIYTGTLQRIRYAPSESNHAPRAVAGPEQIAGSAPLVVSFRSDGTADPENDPFAVRWNFGDGTSSDGVDPVHTYEAPGRYRAVLLAVDDKGAYGRDSLDVLVSDAAMVASPVLDDFSRLDGSLGPRWLGTTGALAVEHGTLIQTAATSYALWGRAVFGPDQEASITFSSAPLEGEHDLLFKVQGDSWTGGHVQVNYNVALGGVMILTYTPAVGWRRIAGPFPATFGAGDRLGGRAWSNGLIEAYRNEQRIGQASVADWPFAASGGRIGMILGSASRTRIDDFRAGNLYFEPDSPPLAEIVAATTPRFFAPGDTISLAGAGRDAQEPPEWLRYRWEIDVRDLGGVRPSAFTLDGPAASFVCPLENTLTGLGARLIVTDSRSASDTTETELHPDVDLEPAALATDPAMPGTVEGAIYRFTIRNRGRMPARLAHWALIADDTLLAQGDTLVGANDSVVLSIARPPTLREGLHDLRVVVDSLGVITESREDNNALVRSLTVVRGAGSSQIVPAVLKLSQAFPNPSTGRFEFALDLPRPARVEFAIFDIQGREVWNDLPRIQDAGAWRLNWNGERRGERARPGLYVVRVRIDGTSFMRRLVLTP